MVVGKEQEPRVYLKLRSTAHVLRLVEHVSHNPDSTSLQTESVTHI